jgi:hydrogenase maturation protease
VSHRTETTTQPPQVVVVGFGNILLKDEGIGVHVIQNMASLPRKSTRIVVDAVKGGGEPGTVYRFTPDDIEFKMASLTSLHQLGLKEGLGMMKFLGKYPERVIMIGIEPKEIDLGLRISPELEKIIPQVALLLEQEIANTAH